MGLFGWRRKQPAEPPGSGTESHETAVTPTEPETAPEPEIRVTRTLVKSEPELAELVASDQRLTGGEIRIELAEKGFGTQVAVAAAPSSGVEQADLERLLDELAEPQKRPFTNT
jgi:hypothetical protein